MNKTYDILAPDGKTILHRGILNASCVRKFSLMEEDSITLSFSLRDAVGFPVGSSCGDFLICRKQEGAWNAATGVWDYKLKFDAYYWAWANKILRYIIPGANSAKETSFTLTATIDIHAAVIKNCLDALGMKYGGSPFRVDTTDASLAQEARLVRYENLSVLGGIQAIAEAFECEWWIDGNAVRFGRCENKETDFRFEAGVNVSSVSFAQGESEAPNRLYVYGSERNLPADYRKTDGNDTIGGVVNKRLMLPEGIPYLQISENIPEAQIVEAVVVLDDVYPKTDLTISAEPETYTSETGEGEEKTLQTFYRIRYGSAFPFLSGYILPGEELHIVFTSGLLNGMDFGVRFNPKGLNEKNTDGSLNAEAQMLEIVANDDYGRTLPDDILKPKKGDSFILYGWDTTKMADLGLIAEAEQRLLKEGMTALEEYRKDTSTCTCPMSWDYMKPLMERDTQPKPGDRVTILDTAHFGSGGRESRVIGYEYTLDKTYASCTYTCGEAVSVSRLKSIERKIDGLSKSGEKVQMQNSLDFLSKRYSDRTAYLLSSDTGFETGKFKSGVKGGFLGMDKATGQSFAEVDMLYVRMKAYFEELTIIKADTIGGRRYQTPGGSLKCTEVEEVRDKGGNIVSWRCWFLSEQDGEKSETMMKAGDRAICEAWNIGKGTHAKVENRIWWRNVDAVTNDGGLPPSLRGKDGLTNTNTYGYIEVSVTDCMSGSDTPQAGDTLVQLGNSSDASRQSAIMLDTVGSDAPSIKLFQNIDGYTLSGKDIVSFGYDRIKGNAYLHCYGDTYIGDPQGDTYINYDRSNKHMDAKLALSVLSTIDGRSFEQYIQEVSPKVTQESITQWVNNITQEKFEEIQNQIDGAIQTFFADGKPTLTNYPAAGWIAESEEEKHLGDLYYDRKSGIGYRFGKDADGKYVWDILKDTEVATALAEAAKALTTAEGKSDVKIFARQPLDSEEYRVGDLWVNATYNQGGANYKDDILRCNTAKAAGDTFDIAHWELASNYIDEAGAQSAINKALEDYDYLKKALAAMKDSTTVNGGLILSSMISLGQRNFSLQEQIVTAGINGIKDKESDIALWLGGKMIDREATGNGNNPDAAQWLARFDGSGYMAGGLLSYGDFGLNIGRGKIVLGADGSMIFGGGIRIDGGKTLGDLSSSLSDLMEKLVGLNNLLVPIGENGKELTYEDVAKGVTVVALKSRVGFYSERFVSALGLNADGTVSGGGLDMEALNNVLKDYALKKDIPSLAGYLTKTSAASTYLTKTDAASLYQPKGDYLVKHQTIHTLTFAEGTFSAKTFNAASGAATVNIPTNTSHISESGNLYFTNARAVAALKTVTDGLASDITSLNTSLTAKINSVNTTLTAKINDVNTKLTTKITSVEKKVDDFKAEFDKIFTPEWSADGKLISIKANAGLWTDQYLSALGQNPDGTTSGGGIDAEFLENYLKDYALKKEIPSLTGYATQSWVNAQGFLKSVSWSAVTGKPSWIGSSKPSYQFSEIGSTPTTIAGYGITDAKIVNGVITLGGNTITPVTDISGKVDKEAGKGLSSNDFTDTLLTKLNGIEAGANKYIHPTNGANTTIAAANGKVISSITVSNLGHVTAVGSKTLAAADIPALAISKITGLRAELDSKLDKSTFNSVFEIEKDSKGNITAIKAKYGFYSIGFVSALGQNPDGTTSGGIDVDFLQNYLDGKNNNHPYKYATESWVNGLFHTLTIQKNGTTVGTFNPKTANATINLTDVASASTLSSHTSNSTIHITSAERTKWNTAATNLSSIMGADSDTIINKWEEVVKFLETYTEADTLANLLGNKADKSQLADYVAKGGDTMTGALHVSIDKAVTHIGLDRASYNYIRATQKGGMIAFVANGLAEGNAGNADLIVSDGSVYPGTTNATALGQAGLRFSNVYSVLGNFSGRITSTVATGNSPFVIASTTVNTNLNADLLDGYHDSSYFRQNRGQIEVSYIDIENFEKNAEGYQNPNSGTYNVQRSGYSELFVNFKGTGSTSALQFYTGCADDATLKFRKTVDSNRVSGAWRTIVTELNIGSMNAGSATKLQTSQKIWGQLFDGTAPVTGSLSGVTDITMSGKLKIGGATIVWDGKMLHVDKGLYSDGAISALGLNSGGAGGGVSYNRYDGDWSNYSSALDDQVVSVKSGHVLLERIKKLEGGSALNVVSSGSGNGVSNVTKSGTTITVTKTTFLTSHQSLADYLKIDGSNGTAEGLTAMINKLPAGDSNVTDNTLFVTSHASTPAGNNYYRRSATFLWSYIKGKANALYQPIGSYVTTNTAQTISAKKTFTSDIVMGTSHYIYGAEETSGAMIQFDGTRTIIGSVGASSTAATHLRSKTGHLTAGANNTASFTVWDSGNDGSGSGLDADLLDGTHKSGLLTAFNRLGDINNKLGITVGGTTKEVSLYPLSSWGLRYVNKDDNGGKPVLVLIADVSAWKGSSKDAAHHGFTGRIVESRTGGYMGEKITDVICRVGYQDANGTSTIHLRTSNPSNVRPKIVSYNSKTYIGFLLYSSGHNCMMEGVFLGCLSTFIQLACTDSNGTLPSGVTDLTGNYKSYNYVAFNAKLETRKLWGNDFDGTGNVGGTMTFNADGDQRQLSISMGGAIKLKAGTGAWAWGLSSIKRADSASLGYSAGAYGQADTLKYHFYGGSYSSPSAVILPTGNMGIGLTNPAYKLEVNGTVKVTRLIIGGATIEWDGSKAGLKVSHGIYSQTYISALGVGNTTAGGGLSYGRYSDWAKTPGDTDVLGANLGVDLNNRVKNLESGSALKFTTTGNGNAVTSVSKSGTSVTITKGTTFLTSHQSLANYYTKTDANGRFLTGVAVGTGDNASKIGVTKNGTTTYLIVPYATKANMLQQNSAMTYGASGLQWFNISGTAGCVAKVNDTPTSAWWHVLRFNHANSNGYYTDLAVPFNHDSLYWKTVRNGSLAHNKWVKVLDELNYKDVIWQMIADSTDLNASKTDGLLYVKSDANAGTLKNSPFANSFAMISKQCYADGTDIRRARIAFSAYGAMKVFNDRGTAGDGGTWYDVVTGGNYTDIVTKIGTVNVGSGVKPIYLNAGTPTASTSTVGGTAKPVYLNAGTITAFSATVGSTTKPVYMNAGTLTALSATAGASNRPVYLNGGELTAVSSVAVGYIGAGGPSRSNFLGVTDVVDGVTANNRFEAIPANLVTVELWNGSAWEAWTGSDLEKRKLFSLAGGSVSAKVNNGTTGNKIRLTVTAANGQIYFHITRLMMNISTNGLGSVKALVEGAKIGSETTYETIGTYGVGGWSGWNTVYLDHTLGGAESQTTQFRKLRITFSGTLTTTDNKTRFFQVFNVLAYGTTCWANTGVVNKWNRPYTYALDTFAATFEGDIKTKSNAAYSLGSSAAIWQNVYTKYVKSNTTLYLDSGASCSTIVSINGTEKARFAQPNGYLGLGITAPTQRIDALGNMRLQSSTSGAGGDVHMELWRGTNASWRILNTNGNLKFQSNYTSTAGSYFDVLQLDYNTGKAWFKNEVIGKSANAFRCAYGTYGAILRTDSSRFWILLTNENEASTGNFNNLRPFSIDFKTGQTVVGHAFYVGGLASLAGGATIPTGKSLKIGDATISWDADKKMLHINKGVYSDGAVSALGMGTSGTSAGVSYNRYDGDWSNYTSAFDAYVVSGKSGNELLKRIKSLEGGSALSVTTTGPGNVVTEVSKSGTAITVTKGSTFLTTSAASSTYQPKGSYVTLSDAQTIKGVKTFDANVTLAATRMINIANETATITKTSTQAIHGGKDCANADDANLRFGSWQGIGWYPTISGQDVERGKNAMWLNVRTGVLTVAGKFVKNGGAATDFLMADGSVRSVKNNTGKGSLGWTNVTDEAANIPTLNTLAYWNGAYAGTSSNLTYCNKGAFGTMATKNAADYLALAGGTMANTNLVTNMNADLVDGFHAYGTTGRALKKNGYVTSPTKGLSSYWAKLATINVGANAEEHDITIYLHSCYNGIYGTLSLRLRTMTDSRAFQARLLSGNIPKDRIRVYYNSTTPNVFELWVNVNAQWGVINGLLLSETGRCGNENIAPTVTFYETSFTTVQTHTLTSYTTPTYIGLLNNAATATSASQLTTSRNLWGRPFNGTANVTGSLTSVGNITGSGAMTISSTNGRLTLNGAATALDLKFAGDNTKSVILNGSAFKPFDDANNKLTLGSTTARWSTLYATAGDFSGLVRVKSALAISPYDNYDADTAGDAKTASGVSVKFASTMPIVSILGSSTIPMINIGSYVNNKLYGAVITAGGNDTSSFLKITTPVLDIASGVITTAHSTGSQLKGNQGGALINSTNTAGTFTMLAKLNTTNGYIMHGVSGSTYNFYYTPKSSVDNGTVTNIKTLLSMTEGGFVAIGSGMTVGGSMSVNGGLELSMATPFIDFHYGKSTADYTTRLIEEASGKLKLIGTFHVTKGIYSDTYVTAKTASTSSDVRLKDIAGKLSLGVKTIAAAPSVFFSWKDDGKRRRHAGTIAQYWKKALPEVVHTNADGFMSVEYGVLGVMMGISLAKSVDVHERRIDRLERENNELRRRVAELERCID